MKPDKWTQQLHDKLAEHETAAPDDLWADIEAALPQQKGRGRLVVLRRWAAAAAVAALVIGGAMVWWGQQQATLMLSRAEATMADSETIAVEEQDEYYSDGEEQHDTQVKHDDTQVVRDDTQVKRHDLLAGHRDKLVDPGDLKTEGTDSVKHTAVTTPRQHENPQSANGSLWHDVPTVSHKPREGRRLTVGLYANNSLGAHDNSNAVFMDQALAKTFSNSYTQSASRQAPVYLTGYEERQHHSQPLSLGLSFDFPLNSRLSLTSGVVYTRLNSTFTQYIRSQQYSKHQTLHYVGVPLGLSYTVWQRNHFRAYLRAATQADWNIHAKAETEGVKQHTDRDRMQWSVSGSLGVQYEVVPRLSLYAEPGLSHYFDNGSSVQNFFKDKPTSLKLEAGIRLGLK